MRFLIWNMQRKSLSGYVHRLVRDHKFAIVVLVESPTNRSSLLKILRMEARYHCLKSHSRFVVFVRFKKDYATRILPPIGNTRSDFWHIRHPREKKFLLCVVHGPDRRNYSPEKQALFFERLRENIEWCETKINNHGSTIVVGDFNANPFESAIAGVAGLHAIPVSSVNGSHERSVYDKRYSFFYNPTWRCYGSHGSGILATHYHYKYDATELFWHMLDQVVIRPQLYPALIEKSLRIITEVGAANLLSSSGKPDTENGSDHLPLSFCLKMKKEAIQ